MYKERFNHRTLLGGTIGNALEWYDFAVYAFLAPIIARLFFPSDDPITSLISTFGVFAAGFLMRPVGSLILGHVADKHGRRQALVLSIGLMAIPTTFMALLPTYETAGVWAPVMLTILRLAQGLSVGGEFPGSSVFLYEIAPPRARCLLVSFSLMGVVLGMLIGSGSVAVFSSVLSEQEMQSWGWRIPFALGLIVGVIGILIRTASRRDDKNLPPSPYSPVKVPILEVVQHHRPALLRTIACGALNAVAFYFCFIFLSNYLIAYLGQEPARAISINTLGMIGFMIFLGLSAYAADRFNRRKCLIFGNIVFIVTAVPFFWLVRHPDPGIELLGQLGFALTTACVLAPLFPTLISLFTREVRVTGYSLGYNLP